MIHGNPILRVAVAVLYGWGSALTAFLQVSTGS